MRQEAIEDAIRRFRVRIQSELNSYQQFTFLFGESRCLDLIPMNSILSKWELGAFCIYGEALKTETAKSLLVRMMFSPRCHEHLEDLFHDTFMPDLTARCMVETADRQTPLCEYELREWRDPRYDPAKRIGGGPAPG